MTVDDSSELAIVIVAWNQAGATLRCLTGLSGFTALRPELWVVDNASKDGVAERIKRDFPAVHLVVNEENSGYGAANNMALRKIRSRYALLLNSDAFIPEEDLLRLLEELRADPRLAAVGPVLTSGPGSNEVVSIGGRDVARHVRTHLRTEDFAPGRLEDPRPLSVAYLPGAAALFRVSVVRELGFLREEYFFGGELADLGETAAQRGYGTVVVPTARGWHDMTESSSFRSSLYPYYIVRNRFLFVRRHRRRSRVPHLAFWTAYGLGDAVRSLATGNRVRGRLAMLGLIDGLRGRYGNQNARALGEPAR